MSGFWLRAMSHRNAAALGVDFGHPAAGWPKRQQKVHWVAGVDDHMALTGRTRLKGRIPFLMRTGASVGGTWMTKDVVSLVILSQGRRVRAPLTAMPVDKCTASTMASWRRAGSEGRAEMGARFIRSESEVGAG